MKKYIFFSILFFSTIRLLAQIPVTDAASNATQMQSLAQIIQQVSVLNEQKNKLDESLDFMRKVNSKISQAQSIRYIIERQKRLSEQCVEIIKSPNLSSSTLLTLTSSVESISSNNRRLLELTNTVLSIDAKMNDAERLAALQNIEDRIKEDEKKIHSISSLLREYNILKRLLK